MKFWWCRGILSEIYDMAKNQKFSELKYVDFRRFSNFLDGNVSCMHSETEITKIRFLLASA